MLGAEGGGQPGFLIRFWGQPFFCSCLPSVPLTIPGAQWLLVVTCCPEQEAVPSGCQGWAGEVPSVCPKWTVLVLLLPPFGGHQGPSRQLLVIVIILFSSQLPRQHPPTPRAGISSWATSLFLKIRL